MDLALKTDVQGTCYVRLRTVLAKRPMRSILLKSSVHIAPPTAARHDHAQSKQALFSRQAFAFATFMPANGNVHPTVAHCQDRVALPDQHIVQLTCTAPTRHANDHDVSTVNSADYIHASEMAAMLGCRLSLHPARRTLARPIWRTTTGAHYLQHPTQTKRKRNGWITAHYTFAR